MDSDPDGSRSGNLHMGRTLKPGQRERVRDYQDRRNLFVIFGGFFEMILIRRFSSSSFLWLYLAWHLPVMGVRVCRQKHNAPEEITDSNTNLEEK